MNTHAKQNDNLFKIALNLCLIALVAGIILAIINFFTEPLRIQNEIRAKEEAKKEVLKEADTFEPFPGKEGWFVGKKNNEIVGHVLSIRQKGFDGYIEMLLGVKPDLTVSDYKILKDKETPGLGAKAKELDFRSRFFGKKEEQIEITKVPSGDKILAITGSTITSKAIANGIKRTLIELKGAKHE